MEFSSGQRKYEVHSFGNEFTGHPGAKFSVALKPCAAQHDWRLLILSPVAAAQILYLAALNLTPDWRLECEHPAGQIRTTEVWQSQRQYRPQY
jgi:hypothetical protein